MDSNLGKTTSTTGMTTTGMTTTGMTVTSIDGMTTTYHHYYNGIYYPDYDGYIILLPSVGLDLYTRTNRSPTCSTSNRRSPYGCQARCRRCASLFNAFLSNEAEPGLSSDFCSSVFTIASEDTKRQSACILFFAIYWHIFS